MLWCLRKHNTINFLSCHNKLYRFTLENISILVLSLRAPLGVPFARNTKGGSITVLLASCWTGLDLSVLQMKTKIATCYTADSKPAKQEVNSTMILPPLVFPSLCNSPLLAVDLHRSGFQLFLASNTLPNHPECFLHAQRGFIVFVRCKDTSKGPVL
jgi:hypothetical protein